MTGDAIQKRLRALFREGGHDLLVAALAEQGAQPLLDGVAGHAAILLDGPYARRGAEGAPSCGSRRAFRSLLPDAAPEVEGEEPHRVVPHRADAEVAEALREDDGAVHRGLHPLVHDQHRAGGQAGAQGDVLAGLPDPVALARVAVAHDAPAPRLAAWRALC